MQLSKQALPSIAAEKVNKPQQGAFNLPEKILQFGTGVLLRGLCDYHIDKANRDGKFNGRAVVVKSTSSGDTNAFESQNCLYTICVRGLSNGRTVSENIISSAISRVLPAATAWKEILALASDPQLQIIISNTTETGLQLLEESIHQQPPVSYPGKLLAFIYHRFLSFRNVSGGELIIIPTELISENGDKLKAIVQKLAAFNGMEPDFLEWMNTTCYFCNSLVDRIVTKDPGAAVIAALQNELGYSDELLTMCEDYHLWAIQGNEYVKGVLTFADNEGGAFVVPDIETFKSLKLHLLNGTHTLSASLAFLAGFKTVKEAMSNVHFRAYVEGLMLKEIAPAIPSPINEQEKNSFGRKVIDRFSNPFLEHQWLNITLQNTTKMRMRNLPVLKEYQRRSLNVPARIAHGFAAYLLFMRVVKKDGGSYFGRANGEYYRINDDHAPAFYEIWSKHVDAASLTREVLSNTNFWGEDLSTYTAFCDAVAHALSKMMSNGVAEAFSIKTSIEL